MTTLSTIRRVVLGTPEPRPLVLPRVPLLTASRATALYGVPDGDPHSAWARANIVYCGGGGKAKLPAMPGVPQHLWFAVHRKAEPRMRAAFAAAKLACPSYTVRSAGCWVYRHQRHDPARPLSNHAWGAAVDVDAELNRLASPALEPYGPAWVKRYPEGLPRAWVEAFCSVGGIGWGGSWRGAVDPMHFEFVEP